MNFNQYSKVGIIGFGREGQSVLNYLESIQFEGEVFIMDRNLDLGFPDTFLKVSMLLGQTYLNSLNELEIVFKSPGVPMHINEIKIAVDSGVKFTSATNLFFQLNKSKKIVVTGSKGKSSTSTMIYQMLKKNHKNCELVGNIGVSMLDFLNVNVDYFVIELSSQQLELLDSRFDYGVFTSFFPDHMDYHGSFEGYMDSKFKFFTLCENPVVNIENQLVLEYLKEQDLNVVVYGDYFNYVEDSVLFMDELIIDLNSSNLVGEDMQKNFLGAMLMSNVLELDFDLSKKVAFDFVYLPHRQEVIKISGKTFVNDSASVTPDSTISALQAFKDTDVLILGGLDRGYDFSQLFKSIIASSVELVCVLPDLELDSYKDAEVKILKFDSIDDCLNYLKSTNYKNILFSPGAPSYNQFQNFYERGDKFKSLLK